MASELISQANRVRNLIGDKHWLIDGHHKEYLLIQLLERHLPAGMQAARGFVIDPERTHECSKEQDILIVDTVAEAPIFHQAGVMVAFPEQVRAAISVKSTMDSKSIGDTIEGLQSVSEVASGHVKEGDIWFGGYFFFVGTMINTNTKKVYEYCDGASFLPDMMSCEESFAFKKQDADLQGYTCSGLAAAVFLAELLSHLSVSRTQQDSQLSRFVELAGANSAAQAFSIIERPS